MGFLNMMCLWIAPHDPPWEHLRSVEHPHLASRHRVEKGSRLQSEIADIDNALSPEATIDQQSSTKWERAAKYCENSSYSLGSHNHYRPYESNSLQALRYSSASVVDTPYSLTLNSNTAPASHSSPEEMTSSSSTMDTNFPETIRSNDSPPPNVGIPDSPEAGGSDRENNSSSQTVTSRPRPFSRKSKAGNQHTVTPSAAGPEGGFICKFSERGKECGKSFKLPSDIRFVVVCIIFSC